MPLGSFTPLGTFAFDADIPFHTAALQQLADNVSIQLKERLRQGVWVADYEDPFRLGSVEPTIVPIIWPVSEGCIELELVLRYKVTGSADVNIAGLVISDAGVSELIDSKIVSSTSIATTTLTIPCRPYSGQNVVICLWLQSEDSITTTKVTGDIVTSGDAITNFYIPVGSTTSALISASHVYALDFSKTSSPDNDELYLPNRKQLLTMDDATGSGGGYRLFIWPPLTNTQTTQFRDATTLTNVSIDITQIGVLNIYGVTIKETKIKTAIQLQGSTIDLRHGVKPGFSCSPNRILPIPQTADKTYEKRTSVHSMLSSAPGYTGPLSNFFYDTQSQKIHRPLRLTRSAALSSPNTFYTIDQCIAGLYDSCVVQQLNNTEKTYTRKFITVIGLFTLYSMIGPYTTKIDTRLVLNDIDDGGTDVEGDAVTIECQALPIWNEDTYDIRNYINGLDYANTGLNDFSPFGFTDRYMNRVTTLQGSYPLEAYYIATEDAGTRVDINKMNLYPFELTIEDDATVAALLSEYKGDAADYRSRLNTKKIERLLKLQFRLSPSVQPPEDPARWGKQALTLIDLVTWCAYTTEGVGNGS